ncbi:MAG: HNH endonuclease [Methanoregula sp.]|uniref:HNH endonuclease n=1 Tax=Methanoregula sp. TaxID=2052170 RepID=UPI003C7531AB
MENNEDSLPLQRRRLKLRIPQNITREHIIQAIEEIKKVRWPPRNNSTTYDLFYQGERYPPKIVVMYANKYANGELFDVSKFSGGEDTTNKFFRARGFDIIPKKETVSEFRYIDPKLSDDQYPVKEKSKLYIERDYRIKIWKDLQSLGNARNLLPELLREKYRIYRGAAGIWCDKERTTPLSEDDFGISVSVLHTGKSYPDDLTEDYIVYHYPKTNRPTNTDRNEIEATKNAKRFKVPIFIISHSERNDKLRDVQLGYVNDWNDENETFLIEFSPQGEMKSAPPIQTVDEQPFAVYQTDRKLITSNSIRRDTKFRFKALKRYGSKCAVCSITIDNLLQAAHVIPKESNRSTDDERNGLILCHNHHDAFDDFLFCIHPETKKIVYRPTGPSKEDLKIEADTLVPKRNAPHIDALQWRYREFIKEIREPVGTKPTPREAAAPLSVLSFMMPETRP